MQNILVYWHQENILDLSQLEDVYEVDLFHNVKGNRFNDDLNLLLDIELYNPHKDDESFKNKIKEIRRDVLRLAAELDGHVAVKKNELLNKGLSPERIH